MNIGICGGTFDPFHRGHLDPILAVRETMQWDRVLYVVAFVQPFKQDRATASPYHRFTMVSAAMLEHEFLYASSMELERGRVSYTVDTLEELRTQYPDDTLDWIIGDDNLEQLTQWKSIDRIFELANFTVLSRGNYELPETLASRVCEPDSRSAHGAIAFAHNRTVPVSSTEIRRRVREDEAIDELVPPPVSRYIHHYGLYRKGQS
ncbi:MAG TPA: nicotinate-nucleotide adenylyltransferase [Thermoanaerobaculia bacterium]|jgi:nicotinate-nucleotide adenylyltransferase|nr:nicotinate-nucleotide adenylyltransferase [Thermoanaerobaculia bacterium]